MSNGNSGRCWQKWPRGVYATSGGVVHYGIIKTVVVNNGLRGRRQR
jgi:hypothetical protein